MSNCIIEQNKNSSNSACTHTHPHTHTYLNGWWGGGWCWCKSAGLLRSRGGRDEQVQAVFQSAPTQLGAAELQKQTQTHKNMETVLNGDVCCWFHQFTSYTADKMMVGDPGLKSEGANWKPQQTVAAIGVRLNVTAALSPPPSTPPTPQQYPPPTLHPAVAAQGQTPSEWAREHH